MCYRANPVSLWSRSVFGKRRIRSKAYGETRKGIEMAEKPFGEAIPRKFTKAIESNGRQAPGLGWELSETTIQELEALDKVLQTSEQRTGIFLVD